MAGIVGAVARRRGRAVIGVGGALATLLIEFAVAPSGWGQTSPILALSTETSLAPGAETPSLWQGSFLAGDWGGARTRISERGIAPYAVYTMEGFATPAGAVGTGFDWTSELEFGLDLDLERLAGLPGGAFHASFLWIEGTNPSETRVGNVNTISNLSAPAAARVYQLWYKQVLGPVTGKLGQVVASDDFMVSQNAALYLNAGFGTYPTFTANINAPTYPLGGPGALVQWKATEQLSVQSGVYVADAGPNDGGNHGFGWQTDQGWVVFYEAAYKATSGALPGTYKAGGYYDTGRFDDLQTGRRVQGDYSFYVLADQTLVAGKEAARTVAGFAGFGLSPQQARNTVYFYGQGGVNATGLWPARPKDVLGLGVSYTRFGDDAVQTNALAGTPVTRQEVIVELTYQAPIAPFLTLQPDLQLVFVTNQSRKDAVVFGLRLQATF